MVRVLHGYKTIKNNGFYEETKKRSKFISYSFPVESELQIQKHLQEIKSKHHDARHHVYAYLLAEKFLEKISDDGEPAGTAGLPIINVIKNFNLKNVLVIVVRYFGGTLLGTGGLRKMYGTGAKHSLLNAGIIDMELCVKVSVSIDYKEHGKIFDIISKYKSKIINVKYLNDITINFYIAKDNADMVFKKISEALNGKENLKILGESYQNIGGELCHYEHTRGNGATRI